jgi:hypothetical protein
MSGIFHFIKKAIGKRKTKRFIYKWAKRANTDLETSFFVKRGFDETELFYDLYWYISKAQGHSHIDSITRRCPQETAIKVIKYVEKHELPMLLATLRKEMEE